MAREFAIRLDHVSGHAMMRNELVERHADVIRANQEERMGQLRAALRDGKRLDEDRYAIKVTPRKPTSKWSDLNRRRWNELEAAGQLEAPGLAAAPTSNSYAPHSRIPELPSYIASAFKTDSRAWRFFQALAPTYRRDFVVWIHIAKRAETRKKRIRESIRLLSTGTKLGLK